MLALNLAYEISVHPHCKELISLIKESREDDDTPFVKLN
jgi:hypothetical protein